MVTIVLVLFGMLLNVGAQVALKLATRHHPAITGGNLLSVLPSLALDPWMLAGLALYAISVVNWFVVLQRVELGVAYPLMSLGYVLTMLIGIRAFHEPVSLVRMLGVLVIIIGVVLITRPIGSLHGHA